MTELLCASMVLPSTLAMHQDAPPLAGAPAVPITTSTGAVDPAAPARPAQDPFGMVWMLIPFLVIMVLVSFMGQRREKKKRATLMSSIKKHDSVQTAGGIIGAVVEIKDDTIVLKIDENSNVRMTFAKSSIVQVLGSGSESQGTRS
ncbi:MAG: preprotein translocase subunit YajC [Phycisphaerales bacterium]|nr:preprotein translocase subunit YajC [Phycisphaerales bacterium]